MYGFHPHGAKNQRAKNSLLVSTNVRGSLALTTLMMEAILSVE
jgi:hypothetical protein